MSVFSLSLFFYFCMSVDVWQKARGYLKKNEFICDSNYLKHVILSSKRVLQVMFTVVQTVFSFREKSYFVHTVSFITLFCLLFIWFFSLMIWLYNKLFTALKKALKIFVLILPFPNNLQGLLQYYEDLRQDTRTIFLNLMAPKMQKVCTTKCTSEHIRRI